MTEAEWLNCRKPRKMLRSLGKRRADRKLHLFLCNLCRLFWDHLTVGQKELIDTQERFADGEIGYVDSRLKQGWPNHPQFNWNAAPTSINSLERSLFAMVHAVVSFELNNAIDAALEWGETAQVMTLFSGSRKQVRNEFQATLCDLLRELFPPIARPYVVQPHFLGGGLLLPDGSTFHVPGAARAIAAGVQQDQAFDRLPILADALEDANFGDRPLLDHLRHGQNHRRGCWALDVVLGRG